VHTEAQYQLKTEGQSTGHAQRAQREVAVDRAVDCTEEAVAAGRSTDCDARV